MNHVSDEDCTWEFCQALAMDEQQMRHALQTAIQCGADPGVISQAADALAQLQQGASGLLAALGEPLRSDFGPHLLQKIREARAAGVGPKALHVAEKRLAQLRAVARAELEQACKGTDADAIQMAIERLEEHGGKNFVNDAAPARRCIKQLELSAHREHIERVRKEHRQQRAEKRLSDAMEAVKLNRPNAIAILESEILEVRRVGAVDGWIESASANIEHAEDFFAHSKALCEQSCARLAQVIQEVEEMLEKDKAGGGMAQIRPAVAAELENAIGVAQATNVDFQILAKARIVLGMLRQKETQFAGLMGTFSRSMSKTCSTGNPVRIRDALQSTVHGMYVPDMTTTQKTRIRHYATIVRQSLT
eukprot:gnl/MRDRNA2_/MRDRNA2_109633_c0_seq1.p1 gnl/MRDRNA2_/MRDRNA2_109633_c0~~gnl/MRDRNA2_/MRDRNA2_109633_c0_seq1.p1  ORF type:complete len:377 (+),score=85.24 gnl/MRDRNA2_/MRDRNA2_109633_c0_seq1:45-1133(+)